MACTSITVPAVLTITGVTAVMSADTVNFPASAGWVRVTVSAKGSGSLRILVDNVEVKRDGTLNPGSAGMDYTYLVQMQPGAHNVCAEAV